MMATPTLFYGLETWVKKKRDLSRKQATETNFLTSVKGCTKSDGIKNEDIRKKLNIFSIISHMENN
jgi:hypothetical protein